MFFCLFVLILLLTVSRVQCEQYRLYNSAGAAAVRYVHSLHSATNMALAVSESCQPTFGDVMGDQVKLSLQEAPFDSRRHNGSSQGLAR